MSGIVIVIVLVVVIGMIFLRLRRQSLLRLAVDVSRTRLASISMIRVRVRNLVALGATAVVIVVLYRIGLATSTDLGRIALLIPMLGACAAITIFSVVPVIAIPEKSTKRTASLERRLAWSLVPRWLIVVPIALALVLAAVTVAFGVAADADGRSVIVVGDEGGDATPFPGFFYGLPLLAALALLAGLVVASLTRVASAGRPSDESLRDADAVLRRLAAGVILKCATAAMSVSLGVMLLLASSVMESRGVIESGGVIDGRLAIGAAGVGSWVVIAIGIAFLAWAVADAVRNPFVKALLPKTTV